MTLREKLLRKYVALFCKGQQNIATASSDTRQRNGETVKKGAFLLGYARVSKADEQDTAARVRLKRCAKLAANGSSRKRLPVAGGTGRNCKTLPLAGCYTCKRNSKT
jgi:hypothetical protein